MKTRNVRGRLFQCEHTHIELRETRSRARICQPPGLVTPVTHPQTRRSARGGLIAELAGCCFFFVIFSLVSTDIGVVLYGAFVNDRACRDAARAGANGEDLTQARRLALAALKAHRQQLSLVTSPALQEDCVYEDYRGEPPPGRSPFVRVSTTSTATMPFFPLSILGCTFGTGRVEFFQTYTYPIIRLRMNR